MVAPGFELGAINPPACAVWIAAVKMAKSCPPEMEGTLFSEPFHDKKRRLETQNVTFSYKNTPSTGTPSWGYEVSGRRALRSWVPQFPRAQKPTALSKSVAPGKGQ